MLDADLSRGAADDDLRAARRRSTTAPSSSAATGLAAAGGAAAVRDRRLTASATARATGPRWASPSRPTRSPSWSARRPASISLVERGRILRDLDEDGCAPRSWPCSGHRMAAGAPRPGISAVGLARGKRVRGAAARSPAARGRHRGAATPRGAASPRRRRRRAGAGRPPRRRSPHRTRVPSIRGPGRVRRVLDFLLRNWPLKLAAIGLATVLYAGLVAVRERRGRGRARCPSRSLDPPDGRRAARRPGSVDADRVPGARGRRRASSPTTSFRATHRPLRRRARSRAASR